MMRQYEKKEARFVTKDMLLGTLNQNTNIKTLLDSIKQGSHAEIIEIIEEPKEPYKDHGERLVSK